MFSEDIHLSAESLDGFKSSYTYCILASHQVGLCDLFPTPAPFNDVVPGFASLVK